MIKTLVIDGDLVCKQLAMYPDIELAYLGSPGTLDLLVREKVTDRVYPFASRHKLDVRAIRCIRAAVQIERPDVIHAFHNRALANAVLATAWMNDAPKIVTRRGIVARVNRMDPASHITYFHSRVVGHGCVSDAARGALIDSGIDAQRCMTVYNWVRVGAYPRPGRDGLRPWQIPQDAFVVGTIATARPVKGIDVLLRAAIACRDLRDVYWMIIGPIRDRRVSRLCGDRRIRDRVRLLGYRADAAALISGADVFVMPSRSEGLCRALLEAMSQGICPVVSDAGGNPEAVRDGIDGLVVRREDVDGLADALRRLHGDRRRVAAFAESARQRICDFFTVTNVADRILLLYRKVLSIPAHPPIAGQILQKEASHDTEAHGVGAVQKRAA